MMNPRDRQGGPELGTDEALSLHRDGWVEQFLRPFAPQNERDPADYPYSHIERILARLGGCDSRLWVN